MADEGFSIFYNIDANLGPIQDKMGQLDKKLKQLQGKMSDAMSPEDAKKLDNELEDVVKSIEELRSKTKDVNLSKNLDKMAVSAGKTRGELEHLSKSNFAKVLGSSFDDIKGKITGALENTGIPGVEAFSGVLNKLGPAGLAAAGGIAALAVGVSKLADIVAEGFQNLATFEAGLGQVSTLLNREQEAQFMEGFNTQLRELSVQSGETFDNLTKGLYDLISAGIPAEEAMTTLTLATQAAQAGATDTSVAVDGLTTSMNAMGVTSEEAGDILFTTVRLGKTTFEELSSQIGQVLPAANAAKVSFEEVGAAIAAMTARGINTAQATTSLNALIREFTSAETIKKFEEAGIAINDAVSGEMRNLGDILTDVMEKEFSNIEYGQLIASDEAKRAFLSLVQEGENSAGETVSVMESVFENFNPEGVTGALTDAYTDMADQVITQQERINRAYEVFTMELGEIFRPLEQAWMDVKANVLQGLGEFFESEGTSHIRRFVEDAIDSIRTLANTVYNIFDTIGIDTLAAKIATHVETIIELWESFRDLAGTLSDIFEGITEWTAKDGSEISKFFDVLIDTIMAPFDLLDGLLDLVGDGIDELNILLGGTEDKVRTLDSEIKEVGETLDDELSKLEELNDIEVQANVAITGMEADETVFEALEEVIRNASDEFPELAARMEEVANSSDTLEEKQKALKDIFEEMKGAQEGVIDEQSTAQLERQAEAVSLLADETENWAEEVDSQGQGLTEVHQRLEDIADSVAGGLISQEDAIRNINEQWRDQETKAEAIAYLQNRITDAQKASITQLSEQSGINENILTAISNQKNVYNSVKNILSNINTEDKENLLIKYQQLRALKRQLEEEKNMQVERLRAVGRVNEWSQSTIDSRIEELRAGYNTVIYNTGLAMNEVARLYGQTTEEIIDEIDETTQAMQEAGQRQETTLDRQTRLIRGLNTLLNENTVEIYEAAENAGEVNNQYRNLIQTLQKISGEYGGSQGTIRDILGLDLTEEEIRNGISPLIDSLGNISEEMVQEALIMFPEQREIDALINYLIDKYGELYEDIGNVATEQEEIEETTGRILEKERERQYTANKTLEDLTEWVATAENQEGALERINQLLDAGKITTEEKIALEERINEIYEQQVETTEDLQAKRDQYLKDLEFRERIENATTEQSRNQVLIEQRRYELNLSLAETLREMGFEQDKIESIIEREVSLYEKQLNLAEQIATQTETEEERQRRIVRRIRDSLEGFENKTQAMAVVNRAYRDGEISLGQQQKLIIQINQLFREQGEELEKNNELYKGLNEQLLSQYHTILTTIDIQDKQLTLEQEREIALANLNKLAEQNLITAKELELREAQINAYYDERERLRNQQIQQTDEIAALEAQLADLIQSGASEERIQAQYKLLEAKKQELEIEEQIQTQLDAYEDQLRQLGYDEQEINDRLEDRRTILEDNFEIQKEIEDSMKGMSRTAQMDIGPKGQAQEGFDWDSFLAIDEDLLYKTEKFFSELLPSLVNDMAQQAAADFGQMFGDAIRGDKITWEKIGSSLGGQISTGIQGLAAATGNPFVQMGASLISPLIEAGLSEAGEAIDNLFGRDAAIRERELQERFEWLTRELARQEKIINRMAATWDAMAEMYAKRLEQVGNDFDSASDKLEALFEEVGKFREFFDVQGMSIDDRITKIFELQREIANTNAQMAQNEINLMKYGDKMYENAIKTNEIQLASLQSELDIQTQALEYQERRKELEMEITKEKYKQLQLEEELTDVTTESVAKQLAESYRLLTISITDELGSDEINERLKTFSGDLRQALEAGLISDEEYNRYREQILGLASDYETSVDELEDQSYRLRKSANEAMAEIFRTAGGEVSAFYVNAFKEGIETGTYQLPGVDEIFTFDQDELLQQIRDLRDATAPQLSQFGYNQERYQEALDQFNLETDAIISAFENYANTYSDLIETNEDLGDKAEQAFDTDLLDKTFTASYDELLIGRFNALERRIQEQRNLLAIAEKAGLEDEALEIQDNIVKLLQDQVDLIGERGDEASTLIGFMEQQGFLEEDIYEWVNKRLNIELELTDELEKQNDEMSKMSDKLRELLKQRQNLELQAVEAGMWTPAQLAQYQALTSGIIAEMDFLGLDTSGEQSRLLDIPHYQSGGYVPEDTLAMLHAGEFVLNPSMVDHIRDIGSPNIANYNSSANNATFNTSIVLEMDGVADVDRMRQFLEDEAPDIVQSGLRKKGLSYEAIS